jgi:nucleoside phosphorylase
MIGIFAAMQSEVAACLTSIGAAEERQIGSFTVFTGDGGFVCRTGVGRIAEEATALLTDELSPTCLLSVGTAGGLNKDLAAADLVVPESFELVGFVGFPSVTPDAALVDLAVSSSASAGVPGRIGRCVTVAEAAWGPDEKSALREAGHDIVEMESYWTGLVASNLGIPFLTARVISDSADQSLPAIPNVINKDGTTNQAAIADYAKRHPEALTALAAQAQRSAKAITNLTTFMEAFVPLLAESA